MNGETCGENGETCCENGGKCRAGIWNGLPGLVLAIAMVLAPFFAKKDGEPPKGVEQPKQFAQVVAQTAPVTIPPLPERAPPEFRTKRGEKAQTPEPPAPKSPAEMESDAWSPADIKAALTKCEAFQFDARVEYKPLPPIRKGKCGTPAPISVKRFTSTPAVKQRLSGRDQGKVKRRLSGRDQGKVKRRLSGRDQGKAERRLSGRDLGKVELRPAATMNCRTANAFDRWLRTVVQPKAWALLDARVIRVRNLASYHCRFRNGGGGGKISEHAFANAIDIAEFVTAKGEHIRVADHWDTGDERAQFLREIHAGACGVFTTVLGPKANAAHKNHFHLDMKRRRYKAFCE